MKVYLMEDEFFPFFQTMGPEGCPKGHFDEWAIEVPDETVKRWNKVIDDFREVQAEMKKASQVGFEVKQGLREVLKV